MISPATGLTKKPGALSFAVSSVFCGSWLPVSLGVLFSSFSGCFPLSVVFALSTAPSVTLSVIAGVAPSSSGWAVSTESLSGGVSGSSRDEGITVPSATVFPGSETEGTEAPLSSGFMSGRASRTLSGVSAVSSAVAGAMKST